MTWRCGICDFDNPEEAGICQICNVPRGVSIPIQNNQQQPNGDQRQFVSSLLPFLLPINPIRQNSSRNTNPRNSSNNIQPNHANIQNNEEQPLNGNQQNEEDQGNQNIEVNDNEDNRSAILLPLAQHLFGTPILESLSSLFLLVLLLMLFFIEHIWGIMTYMFLFSCVSYANGVIKQQVSLKEGRKKCDLFIVFGIYVLSMLFFLSVYRGVISKMFFSLIYYDINGIVWNFWNVLFITTITDILMKYSIMIIFKIPAILIKTENPNYYHKRREYFSIVECTSIFIRLFTPILPWIHFYALPREIFLNNLLPLAYVAIKIVVIITYAIPLMKMYYKFITKSNPYGVEVSDAEILELPEKECSICQDEFKEPIRLPCNHIYCEQCITEWLDQETTCPMCRAEVPQSGNWPYADGNTSESPQFY